jgi:hypothetical protein
MKLGNIKNVLSRATGRSGLLLKKHSPEILMAVCYYGINTDPVYTYEKQLPVPNEYCIFYYHVFYHDLPDL